MGKLWIPIYIAAEELFCFISFCVFFLLFWFVVELVERVVN